MSLPEKPPGFDTIFPQDASGNTDPNYRLFLLVRQASQRHLKIILHDLIYPHLSDQIPSSFSPDPYILSTYQPYSIYSQLTILSPKPYSFTLIDYPDFSTNSFSKIIDHQHLSFDPYDGLIQKGTLIDFLLHTPHRPDSFKFNPQGIENLILEIDYNCSKGRSRFPVFRKHLSTLQQEPTNRLISHILHPETPRQKLHRLSS